MKYSKENQIEDLKYVISEFKRKGLTILTKAKEKELEKLLRKRKVIK